MRMTVSVDIDVDEVLDGASTEDLIAELETRDDARASAPQWSEFYDLLYLGREAEALALLRETVEVQTGRILP